MDPTGPNLRDEQMGPSPLIFGAAPNSFIVNPLTCER
jgi:hypothetical protein